MLKANKLTVAFSDGVIPIQDLSFTLADHQVLAVLGASGLGKTTLLKTLGGIHPIKSGTLIYKDEALSAKKHRIGYVPQGYGLYPWHSVKDNIKIGRKIRKMPEDPILLKELSHGFGLDPLLSRPPKRLSGGEQQRVALARAFYLMPDLFLLDEPFSALDEITRESAYDLFDRIWQVSKPMTLLVTHSLDEALRFGHSILLIFDQGAKQIENPKTPESQRALRQELRSLLLEGRDGK